MITPVFNHDTTIDDMSSLDEPIINFNFTKEAVPDKTKKPMVKKFVVGGAFICLLTTPIGAEVNIYPRHETISPEALSDIVEKTEYDLIETKKYIELITKPNLLDIDSLIDSDKIRGEMEIIADYMKKAKDVYAYCNKEFTL